MISIMQILLRHAGQLQKSLAGTEVGILVSLGLRWECAVGRPKVDKRLHGFQLMRAQQIESRGGKDKVGEATVELLLQVQVVEWFRKV